tara:strand:- start:26458 stop:27705 length:1248 start_codon:yes stop_codon:yes gene_type:complete
MSRLSDIEAELEALRMLVSDMAATLDAKEDGPVDEDVDKKRPGKKDVQDKQEGDAEAEALKKQEEDVEESAFDKFKNGPSALKEFKDETEKRRREFEEFTNGDVGLKQAFFNAPAALEEDVIIGPTHPNIINQIVREPVRFDLGIPKKEDERTNAQPGFITLKAEDPDGDYYTYEVLGLKTGNALSDPSTYTLPLAADGTRGGVQIGYSESHPNYAVKLDAEKMYVTVPWTNTTYNVGDGGLTQKNFTTALNTKLSGIEDNATADQTGDEIKYLVENTADSNVFTDADHTKLNGIAASANNYSLPLATSSALGGVKIGFTESGKNYPVELLNEQMFVNVPWTDTNTTYSVGDGGLTQKNFTTTLKTKLDGVDAGAKDDQTAAEIRYLVDAATDSNVFTDTQVTQLQTLWVASGGT